MSDTSVAASIAASDAIAQVTDGDGWLLDVRELSEWQAGHAPDAHHIPMGEIGARQDELPDNETILVICHSGARSGLVTEALREAGYPASNVAGGMVDWQASGGPVER